jgi:hypothetical protein
MTTPSPPLHSVYARRPLDGHRVGDDLVIFDDRVGKYFATGPVGADIWEMLETPMSFDGMCARLLNLYAIDEATCRDQVGAFLERMTAADLLAIQQHAADAADKPFDLSSKA